MQVMRPDITASIVVQTNCHGRRHRFPETDHPHRRQVAGSHRAAGAYAANVLVEDSIRRHIIINNVIICNGGDVLRVERVK